MKYSTDAARLVKAVTATASLSPNNGKRFQIESTLLTVCEDGALEIQATDTVDSFWFRVDPQPDKPFTPGRVFINSTNFLRAIKEAGKGAITIETIGNHAIKLGWGRTTVKLPAEEPDDAPPVTRFKPEDSFVQIQAGPFMKLLKRVNYAVSNDFKNRAMAFVRVEVRPKSVRLGATDGVRIATVEMDIDKDEAYTATAFTVPIKPAKIKLLVDGDESLVLKIRVAQEIIAISTGPAEMTVRTGAASWSDFDIDKRVQNPKLLPLNRGQLLDLLAGADLLKVRGETSCEFRITKESLALESAATIEGSVVSEMPIEWAYEPFTIKFDPALLLQAINACDGEQVELSFDTNQQPIKLREAEEAFLFLYALGARY